MDKSCAKFGVVLKFEEHCLVVVEGVSKHAIQAASNVLKQFDG